jgi:hypothetical protein
MPDFIRPITRFVGRRYFIALGLALTLAVAPAYRAQAQNLIENPNFANAFAGYTTTGEVFSEPAADYGLSAAVLEDGATVTQAVPTTPGETYLITFLAIYDPGVYPTSFGTGSFTNNTPNTEVCCNFTQQGQYSSFSFTGTATSTTTDLTFSVTSGAEGITDLDVQSAPAPNPGSGGPSLLVGLLILATAVMRKAGRATATSAR